MVPFHLSPRLFFIWETVQDLITIFYIYIFNFFFKKNRARSREGNFFPYSDDIIYLGLIIKKSWFGNYNLDYRFLSFIIENENENIRKPPFHLIL